MEVARQRASSSRLVGGYYHTFYLSHYLVLTRSKKAVILLLGLIIFFQMTACVIKLSILLFSRGGNLPFYKRVLFYSYFIIVSYPMIFVGWLAGWFVGLLVGWLVSYHIKCFTSPSVSPYFHFFALFAIVWICLNLVYCPNG